MIEDQLERPLRDYYHDRLWLHMEDSYAGVRMRKFPEDLRVYERLLWESQADVVVEIGLGHGGSALWFRDRLVAMRRYGRNNLALVISIDRDVETGRANLARADPLYEEAICLVEADVRDPTIASLVVPLVPDGARVFVVDDSAHRYDTTLAALRSFASLVPVDGYIVIEDGHRDIPELVPPGFPGEAGGVAPAIEEWLASPEGAQFQQVREAEAYVVTSSPGGFLRRFR